jgi:hypothetical protein
VLGWLSIGGIMPGTPFADRVLEPDLCWLAGIQLGLEGFDFEGGRSMQTSRWNCPQVCVTPANRPLSARGLKP